MIEGGIGSGQRICTRVMLCSRVVQACDNCQHVGHLAAQCPNPPQCHACGSTAHAKRECPNLNKMCDLCGKVGHLKMKCRQQYS